LSAWRRNEALALDGAMKLGCTTAQLKWSLSASMAHEAERTTVRCEDGRAGGGAMEFAASTAALQLMECAPSTVRLETDLATSTSATINLSTRPQWRGDKGIARPRRRDNELSTRPRRRDNKLEHATSTGATIILSTRPQRRGDKGIARPRRRDNELSTRPRRRDNKLERDGATINATSAAGNENEVRVRGKMRARWTR